MGFLLKAVEQHHDVALIKDEECTVYIPIVTGSNLIESVLDELHKFLTHSLLHLQHIKHIVYLLLCAHFQRAVEREEVVFVK